MAIRNQLLLTNLVNGTANRLMGYSAAGVPTEISAGSGITISAGVISATGTFTLSSGSGTTAAGSAVNLGGTLTGNTTITGATYDFTVSSRNINLTAASGFNARTTTSGAGIGELYRTDYQKISLTNTEVWLKYGTTSANYAETLVNGNGIILSTITGAGGDYISLFLDKTNNSVVIEGLNNGSPSATFKGITYSTDYLTSYTSRSVPDWGSVRGPKTFTGTQTFRTGATGAATAPWKAVSGALNTTAEVGAFEFLTDKPYFTITTGTARKEFTLNDVALTSGRIPYTTTNGRLTDSSGLTYNGNAFVAGAATSIYLGAPDITLNADGGGILNLNVNATNISIGDDDFGGDLLVIESGSGSVFHSNTFIPSSGVGLQYAADYSANYTNRSLADWGSVKGAKTFTGSQTFRAGTATAGTAPIYLQSGTALTTPANGALEYHGSHLYFTIGSTRYQLDQQGGGGGGANLTWTASTRTIASDSGTDAVITLFTSTDPGLVPLSGGGTTNYLRADGNWSNPVSFINTAAANEMIKSDGTNGVPSGIFSTTDGNILLGNSSEGSATRTITAQGSLSSIGVTISSKGSGHIELQANNSASGFVNIRAGSSGKIFLYTNTQHGIFFDTNNIEQVSESATSLTLTSGPKISSSNAGHGRNLVLTAGAAYTVSANGNGGSVSITSGLRRTAGSGVDGNITIDSLTGTLDLKAAAFKLNGLSGSAGQFFRYDGVWATPSGGGGGGITNSALNTELMKSDGTNAISSGVFIPSNGNITMGSGSISGNRTLKVESSSSSAILFIQPKGTPGVGGTTVFIDSDMTLQETSSTPKNFHKISNWGQSWDITALSGSYQINLFTAKDGTNLTDTVLTVRLIAQAISSDGAECYSVQKIYTFKKDGAANGVQVGATTVLHEVNDTVSGTPTCDILPNSGPFVVDFDSGSIFLTLTWTFFVEVSSASIV